MDVTRIDRIPVEVPYREVPGRNMARELPHWRYVEVIELELADGTVGYGETLPYYTWGRPTDADVERATGANALERLWDDSLGAGLQMALFDAVGRATDTPVHALLGNSVRDSVPMSWWCIDMPAEDWLAECERAIDEGYTDVKLKGRPWFDLDHQLAVLAENLPEWFAIDVDFNDTLLSADRATDVLDRIESHPQLSHVETPIPQEDVAGNRRLRAHLDAELALHYGTPEPPVSLCERVCDGFVLMGGASQLSREAAATAAADKSCWLQLVGTGITAAFAIQAGSVFEAAEWPTITCHEMFEESLLADTIAVEDGRVAVPEAPGLGFDVDRDAIERLRITDDTAFEPDVASDAGEDSTEFYARMQPDAKPSPPRLIECQWPEGPTMYFSGVDDQLLRTAQRGAMPYFESGVRTRLVPDDGSDRWSNLYERALDGPVVFDDGTTQL